MEDRERIIELIEGADMLFLTAGMGAELVPVRRPSWLKPRASRDSHGRGGDQPFAFEGKRQKIAQQGLDELCRHVDSLIVIPNDKLMQVLGEDVSMLDAFKAANTVLHGAVAGIAEVIKCPGLVTSISPTFAP